ncbi:MAG: sigma-54 dependent transcriptional regulator [Gammaproteobacteria bacterium]|nr:sigma-54 dependent transcriptional regulator [Gammaproteobacteria bacterium]MBU1646989.1 sigma-54 dependent transcriptional regulator [Gammaproteobacteria bacterium]MBU1972501.1 sigma-54 dependent transcriptional regulator [Gammaproteobacteria bacterium]
MLIVDDDPLIVDSLRYFLGNEFDIVSASSRSEALQRLDQLEHKPVAALVDLGLPPRPHRPDEGFALISELLARVPDIGIIVLSGQNDDANARHARVLGATDFVAKPADPQHLLQLLLQMLAVGAPGEQVAAPDAQLIGDSAPMQKLRLQLRQFANAPFPVLIEGESGSGKELVANALHRLSDRAGRPYFALNCAAIAPSLVEPTLFGHAKGAFTGAAGARTGYFEDAADGTLFLDEIGELPLDLQPKLLRVLENGEYQRVGETQSRTARTRVIAATNRDLKKEVREGRFRADLYHRLSVFTVSVPPVRELGNDRVLLLDHFRDEFARLFGTQPFTLSAEARQSWLDYAFPGNVRELRNIVIRLTTKHPASTIGRSELDDELDEGETPAATQEALPDEPAAFNKLALAHLRKLGPAGDFSLDRLLRQWERAYINAAQDLAQGNISHAAKLLGVNRTTLYNRIETLSRADE